MFKLLLGKLVSTPFDSTVVSLSIFAHSTDFSMPTNAPAETQPVQEKKTAKIFLGSRDGKIVKDVE